LSDFETQQHQGHKDLEYLKFKVFKIKSFYLKKVFLKSKKCDSAECNTLANDTTRDAVSSGNKPNIKSVGIATGIIKRANNVLTSQDYKAA